MLVLQHIDVGGKWTQHLTEHLSKVFRVLGVVIDLMTN